MEHRIIDLHVHSTESDGTLTPTEIVSAAKAPVCPPLRSQITTPRQVSLKLLPPLPPVVLN